jgi:porphobilinogen synthase
MLQRPRRNRASAAIRSIVAETFLRPANLVYPLFLQEGERTRTPIKSLPGIDRLTIDEAVREAEKAHWLGVSGVALFPAIPDSRKDPLARESYNPNGLLQRAIRAIKSAVPPLLVITDVAMDPYSSDGHDGVWRDGQILNDESLPILARMAVAQAEAGADIVAPSDMMDGRVAAIRNALDAAGHTGTGICSYCVKYASAFYGPFREALDSAPKAGDKKTYQMDPRNAREALREVALDEAEGADWLLVKPGLPYLDIVRAVREATALPVAAYHVSGEFAMLKAAAANGWIDYEACLLESLTALRRAGADAIFTYGALDAAALLRERGTA